MRSLCNYGALLHNIHGDRESVSLSLSLSLPSLCLSLSLSCSALLQLLIYIYIFIYLYPVQLRGPAAQPREGLSLSFYSDVISAVLKPLSEPFHSVISESNRLGSAFDLHHRSLGCVNHPRWIFCAISIFHEMI